MTAIPPSALLEARDVTVRLGGTVIVDRGSLALRRGELVALVGPNGAGKTTFVRSLAGLLPCTGMVELQGRPLASFSPRERAQHVAYLPQGHVFHWPMAVDAIVGLGRYPHGDPFVTPNDADRTAVARALGAAGIEGLSARSIATLSGGERARVALARALATEAPVLLADEPTMSLDPRHQLIVMGLLRKATETGTVLAVVHDLILAARYADRVVVMAEGRIVADAAPAEALSAHRIAEVFGVECASAVVAGEKIEIPWRAL